MFDMAGRWMVAGGALTLPKSLHRTLVEYAPIDVREQLLAATEQSKSMTIRSRTTAAQVMDGLRDCLPDIIDTLTLQNPASATGAIKLLNVLNGDAGEVVRERVASLTTLNLAAVDDDDDGWSQARGLTPRDLRDPMTVIDILRSIARADGMEWRTFVGEWGTLDNCAREYGLPWGDWMTEAYANELQLA
jgi:hypothetical protein